jgi:tRNA pseudouridine65 synthase
MVLETFETPMWDQQPAHPGCDLEQDAMQCALRILYDDEHVLVVHKPPGVLTHRTLLDAHESDSVVDRLRLQFGPRARQLAPAHRLDKGTSGVLLLGWHPDATRNLCAQFERSQVRKRYLALVRGWPPPMGVCTYPLARDPERPSANQVHLPASTRHRRLGCIEWAWSLDTRHPTSRYALVEAIPETGRRHQIRRHFKHMGHPLIGDATHGKGPHNRAVAAWLGHQRLWLLSQHLGFQHPAHGQHLLIEALPEPAWTALCGRREWQWDSREDGATIGPIPMHIGT